MQRLDLSMQKKMEELRMICEREIPIQDERAKNANAAFHNSLQSIKLNAEQGARDQVRLGQFKAHLREFEDELVKALAVKTRKEAKRMATSDSVSAVKVRTEEIKKVLQDQKTRKDEYAGVQMLVVETLQERANKGAKQKQDIEEAISWYKRVLGFRIEGGHGVKFIFSKINPNNPNEEYSFTVRHTDDSYTLLDCDPYLDDTKELIRELNKTNGLFQFVRLMREKFQVAASAGVPCQANSIVPDSSMISIPMSLSSVSTDVSESPITYMESEVQTEKLSRSPKRVVSGSSLRRSSRKVKKMTN